MLRSWRSWYMQPRTLLLTWASTVSSLSMKTPRSRTFTTGLTDFLPTIRASFSTKRFLFDLKCTKIAGGWGSAPDPAGRAYSAPPAVRRFGRGGKGEEGRGGERERGKRWEGWMCPLYEILNMPLLTELPPQTSPPLNVGLCRRAQITSSFAT